MECVVCFELIVIKTGGFTFSDNKRYRAQKWHRLDDLRGESMLKQQS